MRNSPTKLCLLALKYGTDKCPQIAHTYTPFYYHLFKSKQKSIKKVLEIGIGPYKGRKRPHYTKGASLYMWQDFFPNAEIFGADINPEVILNEGRIKSFVCDQRKKQDIKKLLKNTGADIDIAIDDGSHSVEDQIFTCRTLMPLLQKGVTYIIEDVIHLRKLINSLDKYQCQVPQIAGRRSINQLVVVKHK